MRKKRIVTIVGARPQFIKSGPVSKALADENLDEITIHTGQHYDDAMSDVFFRDMGLKAPDHMLSVGSGNHGAQTGRMLAGIEALLLEERPDWVLVYGDTNSTLAGALAAAKIHVPVAHVEAGLRSYNRRMPEEINRVLTDQLSELLFTPNETASAILRTEGHDANRIVQVGDVMLDATHAFTPVALANSRILSEHRLESGKFCLATVHRAENTDDPARLRWIVAALCDMAEDLPVVLPLHPRTRAACDRAGLLAELAAGVQVIKPVGYLDMLALEANAQVIVTDSGGVQKEAYFHGVPCMTLRDETEWTELVEAGWNTLVPPGTGQSLRDVVAGLERPAMAPAFYGDGTSAVAIAETFGRVT